jgi:GNAT superfamily N-acetyltransferase
MSAPKIALAETDDEIARCFEVMHELRPQLDAESFLRRVREQRGEGYSLARLEVEGEVVAVAGYRILHNLVWGKFLYVDDLVTRARDHSKGLGQALFAWLLEEARAAGCQQFELDSGVQRFGAHRFYLGQRMDITCHHFSRKLG